MKARILIVEDDPALLSVLEASYRRIFIEEGYEPVIELCTIGEEARECAKSARSSPYDFVSLDVNLGQQVITGLHVLAALKQFRSAWMVALLTGVETDAKLDQTMGSARGDELRKQLRREAYANFPAERLLVVEKPAASLTAPESRALLMNRLKQIVLVYSEVSRLRYVFRPIEVDILKRISTPRGKKEIARFRKLRVTQWQISFNCGEIRTLPDMAGFRMLHHLLRQNPNDSVTAEELLAIEPKTEKKEELIAATQVGDPLAAYFKSSDIDWPNLSPKEQQTVIRAALSPKIEKYVELRSLEDDDDITPSEEAELNGIKRDLGPLAAPAENVYQRLAAGETEGDSAQNSVSLAEMGEANLHFHGGNYDRLGDDRRGLDSPAAMLCRARMKRVRDCLRENGFADFAEHIASYVRPDGGKWSYLPPDDVEWTV